MGQFLKVQDKEEWQKFLDQVLFKTFFHEPEWENFLESRFKWLKFEHYLYQDKALLSLARVKIGGKEKLVSHPFCEYGGPLPLTNEIDREQFRQNLFNHFQQPIKISFHPFISRYFTALTEQIQAPRATYFIEDLNKKTREECWNSFRKTLRHCLNQVHLQALVIEACQSENEFKKFYRLYLKTCQRNKTVAYPFPFLHYFLVCPAAEIILAKLQGRVIAGSIFLLSGQYVHYFLNASDVKYRQFYPNHLILWTQIQRYSGKDFHVFDLGGTRIGSPLETFKTGWGAKKYPIFELTNVPPATGLRESKLRQLWGLLPAWAIAKLSPYFLKYKL